MCEKITKAGEIFHVFINFLPFLDVTGRLKASHVLQPANIRRFWAVKNLHGFS